MSMPKFRAFASFPQQIFGMWYIESPPGNRVFSQNFQSTTSISVSQMTLSKFSAYVFVDAGVSGSGASSAGGKLGAGITGISESLYITTTPGVVLTPNMAETTQVSVLPGSTVSYKNAFKTGVSVTVS
jgi:hypothetical protein